MPSVGWKDRLRYRFDTLMGRGTPALIGALASATLVTAVAAAGALTLFRIRPADGDALTFGEAIWQTLMHAFDPGAVFADNGALYRLVMFFVGIVGLFIFSTLIGVLTAGVSEQIDGLRKGRSRVLERGHTVVLGWSPRAISVLAELVIANESRRDAVVVVLAPEDKVVMEDTIRERLDARTTRFICRSGSYLEVDDLAIANVAAARSVIVLPPDGTDADMMTIKTLLALRRSLPASDGGPNVVYAMRDLAGGAAARLAAPPNARSVLSDDLIARITAQACRQPGLSVVIQELLDFGSDEIYFAPAGFGAGATFGEQALELGTSVAIGIRAASGAITLNPHGEARLAADDRLIVIAKDEDQIRSVGAATDVQAAAIVARTPTAAAPERTLILGWNARAPRVLHMLEAFAAPGSTVVIVAPSGLVHQLDHPLGDSDRQDWRTTFTRAQSGASHEAERREGGPPKLHVEHQTADITRRSVLESLDVPQFGQIIVLASDATEDPQVADARTLITLLHIRDIVDHAGVDVPIVSEMLDARNGDLAAVTRADDFIVSDRLIGLLLVQLAENPELDAVMSDLFDPEGTEIYIKPASDYVALGEPVSFNTIVTSALRRGETAMGYRIGDAGESDTTGNGVVLNPDRTLRVAFTTKDRVIVLAER